MCALADANSRESLMGDSATVALHPSVDTPLLELPIACMAVGGWLQSPRVRVCRPTGDYVRVVAGMVVSNNDSPLPSGHPCL